jgi:hypothetical protein
MAILLPNKRPSPLVICGSFRGVGYHILPWYDRYGIGERKDAPIVFDNDERAPAVTRSIMPMARRFFTRHSAVGSSSSINTGSVESVMAISRARCCPRQGANRHMHDPFGPTLGDGFVLR